MNTALQNMGIDYVLHLQKTRNQLRLQLEYWLPKEDPLPHGMDDISREHRHRWNEAKRLLQRIIEEN